MRKWINEKMHGLIATQLETATPEETRAIIEHRAAVVASRAARIREHFRLIFDATNAPYDEEGATPWIVVDKITAAQKGGSDHFAFLALEARSFAGVSFARVLRRSKIREVQADGVVWERGEQLVLGCRSTIAELSQPGSSYYERLEVLIAREPQFASTVTRKFLDQHENDTRNLAMGEETQTVLFVALLDETLNPEHAARAREVFSAYPGPLPTA